MVQFIAHAAEPYEMPTVLVEEVEPPAPETAWQTFEITAYTAGYESTQKQKGEPGYGITASGAPVREGQTVACPSSMVFGTVVKIEGLGERICQDRGGAITEGHIDVYMTDLDDARAFGRQSRKVRIIKEAE
jgi:3D (Asp-Asp-Asp) domain-containing protein